MEITVLNQLALMPRLRRGSVGVRRSTVRFLVAMVAGLSVNKGRLTKKEAKDIRRKALTIQRKLHRAIAEDAKSFDSVMATFRLPKHTEQERLRRAKMIQRAYQKATVVPERVCRSSAELLEFCRILAAKGNPNAWSDIGVAATWLLPSREERSM
jgi:formiminotetrahydrofolate cyclodeaminase